MFDVNPNPKGNFLSLNVTLNDSGLDPDLAIETASYFGLKKDKAAEEAKQILSIVGHNWRPIAESYGISKGSQETLAPAFSAPVSKRIGVAKVKFEVPDDFDAGNEEIAAPLKGGE